MTNAAAASALDIDDATAVPPVTPEQGHPRGLGRGQASGSSDEQIMSRSYRLRRRAARGVVSSHLDHRHLQQCAGWATELRAAGRLLG